ncbi:Heptaprenyl diphosphate synthase component 2 [compost metagenome]
MATCLKIGALAAGAKDEIANMLYIFGEKLGMSFQIRDDLLDFTQSSQQLGKPAGSDLRKGQVTLPVLYALQDSHIAPSIRSISSNTPSSDIDDVIVSIQQSDALERTEELSRHYLDEAMELINQLQQYDAHEDLQTLLHYFSDRSK